MKAYAPVCFPVQLADIFQALGTTKQPRPTSVFFTSGRMALAVALRCLSDHHGNACREIIIPDFICSSVPQAVRAAGLTPVFCPIRSETWFYDTSELRTRLTDQTAAVLIVYYFGQAPDLGEQEQRVLEELLADTPVVEDMAQAYGFDPAESAPYRPSLRIFSFGPGKSLPLSYGGITEAVDPALADGLAALSRQIQQQGTFSGVGNVIKSWVQSLMLRPALWSYVWRLAETYYHEAASEAWREGIRLSRKAATYVRCADDTLRREIAVRRRNAVWLRQHLDPLNALTMPSQDNLERGVCLRFPVVVRDLAKAQTVLSRLHAEKILVGAGDWSDYGGDRPPAIDLGRRLIALPSYSGSEFIRAKILDVFFDVLER